MALTRKKVIIVGGGTAGWVTAAYLAKILSYGLPSGLDITLIESPDIGIIGVGEGTFPSIRKTFSRIELDEDSLVREASATYKQGIRFVNWRGALDKNSEDYYFHPFQISSQHSQFDVLPYWLLGAAGEASWGSVSTIQEQIVNDKRAPKLINHAGHNGLLNYAYHFDAVELSRLLRRKAKSFGVTHIEDTVDAVRAGENGFIEKLVTRAHGDQTADLYIDCTGFKAQLIGQALGVPFKSLRSQLFTNRAVALQVPYDQPGKPIESQTISTAQENGWTWDIGLVGRRGVGYVYSTDHTTDERAEQVLREYAGPAARSCDVRFLNFEAGYRQTHWKNNCVAIGLSGGFIEPLEATGIGFAEIASVILSNLFPWEHSYEVCAQQFNRFMTRRYEHVVDFIKLHYCLTQRTDTDFWRDNVRPESLSDDLKDRLERWRFRPPSFLDMDPNHDIFTEANWQYVLYGMGYKTDISAQAGVYRYFEDAKTQFAEIRRQGDHALSILPKHRDLIEQVRLHGFKPPSLA
ncbi:tryptophan 7-halogenase [Asticcacaulis sp. SL142]|uniref:tryptophan halogenase family protein n=1 Tax=Asticcacaulis sp. SL142 TaxID=2995155 RepID=UPI00226CAD21|nr:tryptophan halogenase family protein [Asticcacaulis sp. SL142]WAC46850.1 tryptophan 7-halogenase [Asticcacaulis sp. SL142]